MSAAEVVVGCRELGRQLGIRERTIQRLIAAGKIPAIRRSGRWVVDQSTVELFKQSLAAKIRKTGANAHDRK